MWSASIAITLKYVVTVVSTQALIKYCYHTGAYVQYFSIVSLLLEHHCKHSNANALVPQDAFQN